MEENETPNQAELTRNDQLTPDIPLLDWSDFYATIRPGIPDELSASLQLDSHLKPMTKISMKDFESKSTPVLLLLWQIP